MRRALLYSRSYRQAVLATGPVGYWRLGESSGAVAIDEMGLNNGTYAGAPTLGAAGLLSGDPNTAVTFNGVGQYVNLGSALPLAAGQPRTIVIWGFASAFPGLASLFTYGTAGVDGLFYLPNFGGNLRVYDGTGDRDANPVLAVSAGVTHMYVATYNGTGWVFSLDASPYGTPVAGNALASVSPRIGSFPGGGTTDWTGTLDEPAVWGRALTDAENARLFAVGRGY